MNTFDKKMFSTLLVKAKGNRSINQFSLNSQVDAGYISRFINLKKNTPPTPEVLKKIASCSHNGVTYEDLMKAAGYIEIEKSAPPILLSEKIIALRNEKELSQQALSYLLGIDKVTLETYEIGERKPPFEILEKLSEIFDVSIDYLMGTNLVHDKKINNSVISKEYLELAKEMQDLKISVEDVKKILDLLSNKK